GLAAAAGAGVIAALVLPFLIWNPSTFVQDTVTFLIGSGPQAYPINGIGLSAMLLGAGVIHGARDAFPFAVLEVGMAASVWIAAWRWLRRRPLPGAGRRYGLAARLRAGRGRGAAGAGAGAGPAASHDAAGGRRGGAPRCGPDRISLAERGTAPDARRRLPDGGGDPLPALGPGPLRPGLRPDEHAPLALVRQSTD